MTTVIDLYSDLVFDLNEEDREQLLAFQKACRKEDIDFFKSSLIPVSEKKKVLDQLSLSQKVVGFLHQLTLKKRWSSFEGICRQYLEKRDDQKGVLKGIIYTGRDLEKSEVEKIKEALKPFFKGKDIYLEHQKREGLINGIRVEIGGFSFDDSILYHFNQLKEQVRRYGNE